MPEADAASLLREVLDALTEHDLDRVAAVVDEQFEFVDVGGVKRPTAGGSGERSAVAS